MSPPLTLELPPGCPNCGKQATVKLQQTIKGTRVSLAWHCTACDHEWPVEPSRAA